MGDYIANVDQHYQHRTGAQIREDLSDIITIADPVDTPLLSALEKVPVNSVKPEWLTDDIDRNLLITDLATEAKYEGADATFETHQGRERLWNYCQINSRAIDVTGTMRSVDAAGLSDELLYQAERHMLSLGVDTEWALHWGVMDDVDSAADTQAGTASQKRKTSGVCDWIVTTGAVNAREASESVTMGNGATGVGGFPTVATDTQSWFWTPTVASGTVALTRDIFHDNVLAKAWSNGYIPNGSLMLCGTSIKRTMAGFALDSNGNTINERQIPAFAKTLVDTIDVIETDHGTIYINLDRYLNVPIEQVTKADAGRPTGTTAADTLTLNVDETAILIQPDYWKVATLRPFGLKKLAPIGDSDKILIVGEWGVIAQNPTMGCGFGNFT